MVTIVIHKYRKLPVEIEAFQMTKERGANNADWPCWLHKAWNTEGEGCLSRGSREASSENPWTSEDLYWIGTLEGVQSVSWNDFIIEGVNGELYACKPEIFKKTYEVVNDS